MLRYFTLTQELVSDILWVIVGLESSDLPLTIVYVFTLYLCLRQKRWTLLSFCGALIPIWIPLIASTVCRILKLQYSLNLMIASGLSFLHDGNLMKCATCDESSSQKSWVKLRAVDLAIPNVLPLLRYESPVASRHKASNKLTISRKVLGYMRKSSLNDLQNFSSLRFSHNSVNQI